MGLAVDERRLAVLSIAAGSTLGMLGVVLGAIWLMALWGLTGAPWLIMIHPDLMILGFLQLFILGVASILIPRFRNRRIPSPRLGLASVGLIVSGAAFSPLHGLSLPPVLGASLMLAGSLAFSTMLMMSLGRPNPRFAAGDYYLHLGLTSLPILLLLRFLGSAGLAPSHWGYSSLGGLLFSIAGFPLAMMAGVMTRTIHFRVAVIKPKFSISSFIVYVVMASLFVIESQLSTPPLQIAVTSLFIIWAVLFASSIELFKKDTGEQFSRMNERDRTRYLYFVSLIRIAGAWLFISAILAVLYVYASLGGSPLGFALRDSQIHALTLGFIGHVVMGYGPIMLPGLLSRRMPYIGLSLVPPYLLTAGTAWRIVGMVLDPLVGADLWITSLSGIVIIIAIIHFLLMIHRIKP